MAKLQDKCVRRWEDCKALYGDPKLPLSKLGKYASEAPICETPANPLPSRSRGGNRVNFAVDSLRTNSPGDIFHKLGVKEVIASEDFKIDTFASKFLINERLIVLTDTIDSHIRGQRSSSLSRRQLIADNIHNYVKAAVDLSSTQEQFASGAFPGQHQIRVLKKDVDAVQEQMSAFFAEISKQSTQASNASALLSKIQNYSHIFEAAADIERYRLNGQFDEISHIVSKIQNSGNVQTVTIFKKALDATDKSLLNVVDSLKSRLSNSNADTFNKSHCELLIKIQKKGNPVVEMMEGIESKVRKSLTEGDLFTQCTILEEALPFWKVLYDTFATADPMRFQQLSKQIQTTILTLISEFEKKNKELLDRLLRSFIGKGFNENLHNAVKRTHQMWGNISKATIQQVNITVFQARGNLQAWYTDLVHRRCRALIAAAEPGGSLIDYLLQLLDGSELYTPAKWLDLITEPIYWLYDGIHNQRTNVIGAINTLTTLTQTKLRQLIAKYDSSCHVPMPNEVKTDLERVGDELHNQLLSQLLRDLNQEFCGAMYQADLDWQSESLPIVLDGWVVICVNRCLACKVEWGDLWKAMKKDVVKGIVCSVLRLVWNLGEISETGKARISLDVAILQLAFGNEPADIWKAVNEKITPNKGKFSNDITNKKDAEFKRVQKAMDQNIKSLKLN